MAGWLTPQPQGFTCLLPSIETPGPYYHARLFTLGFWRGTRDPPACQTGTVWTEPSPSLQRPHPPSPLKTRFQKQQGYSPRGSHLLFTEGLAPNCPFLDGGTRSSEAVTCLSSHLDMKSKQEQGKSEGLLIQPHRFRGTFAKKMIKSSMKKRQEEKKKNERHRCWVPRAVAGQLEITRFILQQPGQGAEGMDSLSQPTQLNPFSEKPV